MLIIKVNVISLHIIIKFYTLDGVKDYGDQGSYVRSWISVLKYRDTETERGI